VRRLPHLQPPARAARRLGLQLPPPSLPPLPCHVPLLLQLLLLAAKRGRGRSRPQGPLLGQTAQPRASGRAVRGRQRHLARRRQPQLPLAVRLALHDLLPPLLA
jgi:hypothetical protein